MSFALLAMPGNEAMAGRIAAALGGNCARATVRRFPDGESYVRIDTRPLAPEVAIVCTLDRPDDKALPLLYLAAAARAQGARRVGLVAPYLAYLRQDRLFQDGEALTSLYFARLISNAFDWLITVDPHLHRYHALTDVYTVPAEALAAAPTVADWIRANVAAPLLIGPDAESAQWVEAVARHAQAPCIVLRKVRRGDRDVEVTVPDTERWRAHTPVLVDDIISTARTMIETAGHLKHAGLAPPVCVGVHAVFAGDAHDALLASGAARIVTCNTIAHRTNAIDVSSVLADGVARAKDGKISAGKVSRIERL